MKTLGMAAACFVAAGFVVAGALLDRSYSQSTPGAVRTNGTVVDFVRRNVKQVYPVFEFRDLQDKPHRVVNPTQQAMFRLTAGDSVAIAYSGTDPDKARIDTFWFDHRWLVAGIIVALTVGAVALRQGAARSEG